MVKMAQKTENEETEFKVVPETLTLCVNNCGFTGSPATNNMCQKCFNATATTASATTTSTAVASGKLKFSGKIHRSSSSRVLERSLDPAVSNTDLKRLDLIVRDEVQENTAVVAKREVNRCSGCRKKVGLTGFRCRCGEMFCGEHRYSDQHDCSYDYKSAGRETIARENPVIRASKIVRF